MLKNNIYNINKEFHYSTIKAIVIKSLEKMVREEEVLRNTSNIPDVVLFDCKGNVGNNNNVKLSSPPAPSFIEVKDQKCNKISKLASFDIKVR
jgi:hypothetical protein